MTIIKAMHGTMPIDLHLVDDDEMDRMLKLPSARAASVPQYVDHRDRLFPIPSLPVKILSPNEIIEWEVAKHASD